MKKGKLAAYLGLAIALALTFALAGCSGDTADKVELDPSSVASSYLLGSVVDCTTMRLLVKTENGVQTVPITGEMVKRPPDTSAAGQAPFGIRYANRNYTFYVSVREPSEKQPAKIRAISVTDDSPETCTYSHSFWTAPPTGLAVNVYRSDGGVQRVAVTEDMMADFDRGRDGTDFVAAITYEGASCAYPYAVGRSVSTSDFLTQNVVDEKTGDVTAVAIIGLASNWNGTAVSVKIPPSINGHPVNVERLGGGNIVQIDASDAAEIGEGAFAGASELREVKLPASLKKLPVSCFEGCGKLTSVNLTGVREYGSRSLYGTALASVSLPESLVTKVGALAFGTQIPVIAAKSEIKRFQTMIPEARLISADTLSAGQTVFETVEDKIRITGYLSQDAAVTVPAEINGKPVTEIAAGAYAGNRALVWLEIPASVGEVASGAFATANLQYVFLHNRSLPASGYGAATVFVGSESGSGTLFGDFVLSQGSDGNYTVREYLGNERAVSLPAAVNGKKITSVGENAFSGNQTLRNVELPEGVVSIQGGAFRNCPELVSVAFPETLESIGAYAFAGCESFGSVFRVPKGLSRIEGYAFSGCTALNELELSRTEDDLSVSAPQIDADAFYNCTEVSRVKLSGDTLLSSILTSDGNSRQSSLQITVAEGTKFIMSGFADGLPVRSVTLPESLSLVGHYAFRRTELESLQIPANVTSIGAYAFSEIDGLARGKISFLGDEIASISNAFADTTIHYVLCPAGKTAAALAEVGIDGYTKTYERDNLLFGQYYDGGEAQEALLEIKMGRVDLTVTARRIGRYALNDGVAHLVLTDSVREVRENALSLQKLNELTAPVDVLGGSVVNSNLFTWQTGETRLVVIDSLIVTNGETKTEYGASLSLSGLKAERIRLGQNIAADGLVAATENLKELELNGRHSLSLYNGAAKLESLTLSGTVSSFAAADYTSFTKLKSVTIDAEDAEFASEDGVVYNADGTRLLFCPRAKTGVLSVSKGVRSAERNAFYRTSLSELLVKARGGSDPDFIVQAGAVTLKQPQKFLMRFEQDVDKSGCNYTGVKVGPKEAVVWLHDTRNQTLSYDVVTKNTAYAVTGWYTDSSLTHAFVSGTKIGSDTDLYR